MARISTPRKLAGPDVQQGSGSELDFDAEANWQLNNELENASPDPISSEHRHLQQQTPVASMGADQSRPATNAEIRAAAAARMKEKSVTQRVSTGMLKAPSAKAKNPAYRNPVASTTSAQRKLVSAYDTLEDPELTKPSSTNVRVEFSPLKKQRNRTKRVDETPAEATAAVSEDGEDHGEEDIQAQNETQVQDAHYIDRFPDAVTRRFQQELEAAAGGGAADEEEVGGEIRVASPEERTAGDEGLPDAHKASKGEASKGTRRGRPKKVSAEPHTPPQTKTKRKPGRPKKSIAPPIEPEQPEEVQEELEEPEEPEKPEDVGPAESEMRRSPRKSKGRAGVAADVPSSKVHATHSTRSKKKSKGRESARENLLRRYSQKDPDDQPDDEDAGAVEEDEEQGDEGLFVPEETSPQQPLGGQRARTLRPSEVLFPNAGGGSIQPSSSSNSKKRSARTHIEPNTAKKRTYGRPPQREQQDEPYEDQDEDPEEEPEAQAEEDHEDVADSSPPRLYGQWQNLKRALKFADLIGRTPDGDLNDIPLNYADVQAIHQLCNNAIQLFKTLRTQTDPVELDLDPIDSLIEIAERVDGLRGDNADYPTDFTRKTKAREIYFHVIRKLPRLMKALILCYEPTDAEGAAAGQLKMGHAKLVVDLIDMTMGLIDLAKQYPRPPSHLRVVAPAKQMKKPLSQIRTALLRRIHNDQIDQQAARQREQGRLDSIARREEEARRKQQEARVGVVREKWQKLHRVRQLAEGGLMPNAKRIHLQIPDQYHTEVDYNGIPFEREEIFAPRVGPPPDLVEAAMMRQWSLVELSALNDGLKNYTGPNVYERIFWKYCVPRGELNKYNVTEIVVQAAEVKQTLTADQMKRFGDVEEWITVIPVSTLR